MAIYAVSDLHGQYDAFIKGLDSIGFGDNDELYLIGDAIDRGPDGIRILQYIKDHSNMDLIIGNHEFMMLNSVASDGEDDCNGPDSDLWLFNNGGNATYDHYLELGIDERRALLLWLNQRYIIKTVDVYGKHFCMTHSFYRPEFENKLYSEMRYEDIWDIVWKSVFRKGDTWIPFIYEGYDYTFITGHVPVQRARIVTGMSVDEAYTLQIYEEGNLIDIDGGCAAGYDKEYNSGALFLRLDDMQVFPVPLSQYHI